MSDEAGQLILEMHRIDGAPWSPMQMISAELLAHYRRCEAELAAIKAAPAARHFARAISASGVRSKMIQAEEDGCGPCAGYGSE